MDHETERIQKSRSKDAPFFVVRVPPSDIDHLLDVSLGRALFTLVALLLVVTDIPRTGLVFDMETFYDRVTPGMAMYYGPYEYHMAHLNTTTSSGTTAAASARVVGSVDGSPLEAMDVWAFKFDTLSIPTRALAEYLNISSYPPCVLYRGQCESSTLDLGTVFQMLDDLVTAICTRWFQHHQKKTREEVEVRPFVFSTVNHWVDRIHQYIYRFVFKNPARRVHSVHHLPSVPRKKYNPAASIDPVHLCDDHRAYGSPQAATARPVICDFLVTWLCDHPIEPVGERQVPIWDHIAIRYDDWQRRYPDLELDLTLFTSQLIDGSNLKSSQLLPSVKYISESIEVTTLIRGQRRCGSPSSSDCETVFLDDYRYERATIESNADNWGNYAVVLRGGSQLYVWIRVVLLVWGCFKARTSEPKLRHAGICRKAMATFMTILKIPSALIIYGSWVPLLGYSLAHFFDSCLSQSIGEFRQESAQGFYNFNLIEYTLTTALVMRNIWMIALLAKLGLRGYRHMTTATATAETKTDRATQLRLQGVLAARSGWIGLASWLTTFSFVRGIHFRDTDLVSFHELPRQTPVNTAQVLSKYHGDRHFGYEFDLKCIVPTGVLLLLIGLFMERVVWLATRTRTSVFTCRFFYVPFSAGSIWPESMLDMVWGVHFRHRQHTGAHAIGPGSGQVWVHPMPACHGSRPPNPRNAALVDDDKAPPPCAVCHFAASSIHWRATQGCRHHEPIFDLHFRTKEMWTVVRLMNIGAMTDPLVLARLYVIGMPLFLYRVHSKDTPEYLILLPTAEAIKQQQQLHSDKAHWKTAAGRASPPRFEFVQQVDSRSVPWHVMVNCG